MEELKKSCMELSQAELQHLLFHLQKNRDDLLILMTFTKEFFTMDATNFKDFKNWLLYNEQINMGDVLASVLTQLKVED